MGLGWEVKKDLFNIFRLYEVLLYVCCFLILKRKVDVLVYLNEVIKGNRVKRLVKIFYGC